MSQWSTSNRCHSRGDCEMRFKLLIVGAFVAFAFSALTESAEAQRLRRARFKRTASASQSCCPATSTSSRSPVTSPLCGIVQTMVANPAPVVTNRGWTRGSMKMVGPTTVWVTPTPVSPAAVTPAPVAPAAVTPAPVAPAAVAPTPANSAPVAPPQPAK